MKDEVQRVVEGQSKPRRSEAERICGGKERGKESSS